jgi:pimeloyl-ACP methyl ester carboxylesterase
VIARLAAPLLATCLLASCIKPTEIPMTTTPPTATTHGYAPINGLSLYHEIHGSGEPLIVLHGGLGSVEMFGPSIALLARTRQVIGVDLRAHGRTGDVDERSDQPLSCELMADDIAALIAHLGFATADVMGYSLGGGVALQTAIRHPDRVRKLVVVSAAMARAGWFPEVLAGFDAFGPQLAEMMKPSPVYAFYQKVAPRPADFPRLIDKLGAMLKVDYDWTDDVAKLRAPVLIVAGDADGLRPAHLIEMFATLGGGLRDPGWDGSAGRSSSQLAILPGATHYDIVGSPALAAIVEPFLAAPVPAAPNLR